MSICLSLLRLTWEGSCIAVFVLCIVEGMGDGTQKTVRKTLGVKEKKKEFGERRTEREKKKQEKIGREERKRGERIRMNELIKNYLAQKK